MKFQLPSNDDARVKARRDFDLLDPAPQPSFGDGARPASGLGGMPIAMIGPVDKTRPPFKSKLGLAGRETARAAGDRGPRPLGRIVTGCLLLLALLPALRAVQPYAPKMADPIMDAWRWQKIVELDGKNPRCMAEGKDGAMWFGVTAGVMRFDGERWQTYTPKDGLVGTAPAVLCTARDGKIYVGTADGISRFSDGRWERIFPTAPEAKVLIYSLVVAADGSVWAGSDGFMLHVQDGHCTVYCSASQNAALRRALREATIISLPENVPMGDLVEVYETRDGLIWYALLTGELVRHDPQRASREGHITWRIFTEADGYSPGTGQRPIFQTDDGVVWLGSGSPESKINRYDPVTDTWAQFSLTALLGVDNLVRSIMGTRDGTIWFCGLARISRYQDGKWQSQTAPELPLPSAKILLHESRAGDLWLVGSGDEAQKIDYRKSRWLKYEGLNFQCETPDGRQWFVAVDDGVVSFDGKQWQRYGVEDGLMSSPYSLICTREGQLWAAGTHEDKGATAWLTGTKWNRKTLEKVVPEFGFVIDYRAVFEAADGSLWFGTYVNGRSYEGTDGGILRYDPRLGPPQDDRAWENRDGPLIVGRCSNGLAQMADGTLFSGSFRGLMQFDGKSWTRSTTIPNIYIDALSSSREGKLWAGTRGDGLLLFDGKQVTRYGIEDGLKSNAITALFCDRDNHLWVGTSKGISNFDGQEWTTDIFPETKLTMNFEGGGFKQAADGAIWVNLCSRGWLRRVLSGSKPDSATIRNFSTVRYLRESDAPRVEIVTAEAQVSQPGNTVIEWRGLSPWLHTGESDLQYSERLDEGRWSKYADETSRAFLQLAPGSHRVEVRVRDRDLNVTRAQVAFVVLPPIWRQLWFIGLMTVLIGAVAAQTTRVFVRERRLLKSNQALTAEIKERTRLEREIETAHQQLLVASREAGMAEVATGVLHNVGNVLNSVNVSATLVADHVRKTKAGGIAKLAAMLAEHREDLAGFLTNDARGRMIPGYLGTLAESLAAERTVQLAEIDHLRKNIEHIKDIVAMQQSFAKNSGFIETVALTELVEDALRINVTSLQRHDVELVRDFQVRPTLSTDKRKVMQILVNLLNNAKQACVESRRPDQKIVVRVTSAGHRVQVAIIDNGAGIPAENLIRIFNQGFTTKKTGHGFGLHSCAIDAKGLGGSLAASSGGPGLGATFVLELPLDQDPPAPKDSAG